MYFTNCWNQHTVESLQELLFWTWQMQKLRADIVLNLKLSTFTKQPENYRRKHIFNASLVLKLVLINYQYSFSVYRLPPYRFSQWNTFEATNFHRQENLFFANTLFLRRLFNSVNSAEVSPEKVDHNGKINFICFIKKLAECLQKKSSILGYLFYRFRTSPT